MPLGSMIAVARSSDGVNIFFPPDEKNVIFNLDIGSWLEGFSSPYNLDELNPCECPICLEFFSQDDKVSVFTCGHTMHYECAKSWIRKCMSNREPAPCPICNTVVICPVFALDNVGGDMQGPRINMVQTRGCFWGSVCYLLDKLGLLRASSHNTLVT